MRLSSANYTTSITKTAGGPGCVEVAGDDDGDGRTDLALYTPAGNWLILLSSSGYTTTLNKSWGGSGCAPVPAYP